MAKSEQKKAAALEALLESGNLTEAAEKAGISRRTMYSYLHDDIAFARAYNEARDRQAMLYMDDLNKHKQRANAVILEIMEDKEQPAPIRLKAAQTILTAAMEHDKLIDGITQ